MKTKEELEQLKEEVAALNVKLAELTDEELKQVSGGGFDLEVKICPICGNEYQGSHFCPGKF